uniref:TIL domain containing protein n=1 Tax=Rhipicephalus appendiculatus TaxID=34631 RepID=A0A131YZ87_RHIAP
MQHIVVTVAMICIVAVNGGRRCGNKQVCGPSQCGPLERPVHGSPRRDRFCRPLFTPPWELWKLRSCVCKRRYLRNSWGECVPRLKCIPCKFKWQRDYRTCAPGCPATCNKTFRMSCNVPCTAGCVCPPSWVVHPRYPRKCVKAYKCLPKCPPHSSYQACVSTCRPKCGQKPPKKCHVNCERGACICKKGYLESERNGKRTCVLQAVCSWNTHTTHLFTENTGTMEGSRTSRTFINEPESVLGHPEHGDHSSTIATVPPNITSTHLQGTSSRDHAGHATATASEGGERILSGGGRIGSTGVNTRLRNPIGTAGTSTDTEVTIASGSSGVREAVYGAHSNDALQGGPARIAGSVTESAHIGRSPNPGPTITDAFSEVRGAAVGVPSAGALHPGPAETTGIPGTDTELARGNIHLGISGNTGVEATSGSSEVGEAASRVPLSSTMRQDSASRASRVGEPAGGHISSGNLRNRMVPGTTASSGVSEATFRATSTGTLYPSPTTTASIVSESEGVNTRGYSNTVLSPDASGGSARSVTQPQGVIRRPGYASQPAGTGLMNAASTGLDDIRSISSADNTMVHMREGTRSVVGAGRTGGRGGAGGGIGVTHSINTRNSDVSAPRSTGNAGGSGSSGLGVATVRVPSDSSLRAGLAHIGSSVAAHTPISAYTSGSIGIPSATAEANPNGGATIPGNAAGSAAPGSTLGAAGMPSQTDLGSSTHNSGPNFSSAGTRLMFGGSIREGGSSSGTIAHGGSVGTGVMHDASRPVTASTGIAVNSPEATGLMVSRESPTSATMIGSPAMVSHVAEQRNRYRLGVLGASTNSDTATGIRSTVNESGPRNIPSPVAATPLTYGTTINTADLSRNKPPRLFTSTPGETSLGTNAPHVLATGGRSIVLPGATPSPSVDLSRGTGTRSEGSAATLTENILPPFNEEAALASTVSAALGIHGGSEAHRRLVPVRRSSNREAFSPGALNDESSASTGTTSASESAGSIPIAGRLSGVGVSTVEGAAVTDTRTIPTAGTRSSLLVLTESIGGTPTRATGSTPGSVTGTTILNGIPTVPSETVALRNIFGSINGPSSGTAAHSSGDTNTIEATPRHEATPSDSMPVGAETILRALSDSARTR